MPHSPCTSPLSFRYKTVYLLLLGCLLSLSLFPSAVLASNNDSNNNNNNNNNDSGSSSSSAMGATTTTTTNTTTADDASSVSCDDRIQQSVEQALKSQLQDTQDRMTKESRKHEAAVQELHGSYQQQISELKEQYESLQQVATTQQQEAVSTMQAQLQQQYETELHDYKTKLLQLQEQLAIAQQEQQAAASHCQVQMEQFKQDMIVKQEALVKQAVQETRNSFKQECNVKLQHINQMHQHTVQQMKATESDKCRQSMESLSHERFVLRQEILQLREELVLKMHWIDRTVITVNATLYAVYDQYMTDIHPTVQPYLQLAMVHATAISENLSIMTQSALTKLVEFMAQLERDHPEILKAKRQCQEIMTETVNYVTTSSVYVAICIMLQYLATILEMHGIQVTNSTSAMMAVSVLLLVLRWWNKRPGQVSNQQQNGHGRPSKIKSA